MNAGDNITDLLAHLYSLAIEHGGELHADANEIALCFPNNPSLPDPEPPKRQDVDPWPAPPSGQTVPPLPARHSVLTDMNQFLQEQDLRQKQQAQYDQTQQAPKYRTGDLPFRNYPDGRPPRR